MNKMHQGKVRLGMVGGGEGAFIGGIHRLAAQMDGQIELVCGAFSSKPDKAKVFGKTLFLVDEVTDCSRFCSSAVQNLSLTFMALTVRAVYFV